MNKYKSILILLLGLLTMSSCSGWLDEDPKSLTLEKNVGDSEEAASNWVTGVYSKWIYDMFCWGYFPKVLEMDADYISGPDWLMGTFGAGNFQGESDVVDALWKGCYGLIERANNAERHIAAMQNISDAVKNNAIGEVRFQKAFCYFLLVRAYGPVPLRDESGNNEYNVARSSVADVYSYIITNLESAAQLMYKNTDRNYQAGHVNAGSAAGLLAKVYATEASAAMPAGTEITVRTGKAYTTDANGDKDYAPLEEKTFKKETVEGYQSLDPKALYQKAAQWAKAVIDGQYGSYELLAYDQLWKKASATASEFMFSVGSVSGDATYKNSVHTQYEGYKTATGSDFIQSGGWLGCSRHWYDLFDHDDYRITKGVKHRWRYYTQQESNTGFFYPNDNEYTRLATGYDKLGNGDGTKGALYNDGVSYYYSMDAQCLAFTTKYSDVTNDAIDQADANWPFLRFADVLLIYAEAENELGNQSEARSYLNKVRQRSNANELWDDVSTTKLRSLILEERAKEFACEADRRWDLIRWGIYLQAMNALEGSDDAGVLKNRQSRNLLYPIPAEELNTNKAITENNPGWQ